MNYNLENIKEILDCYFSEEKANFEKIHEENIQELSGNIEDCISNDTLDAIKEVEQLPITKVSNKRKINGGDAEEYYTSYVNHDPKEHIFYNLLRLKKDYEEAIRDLTQNKLSLEVKKDMTVTKHLNDGHL